MTPYGRYLLPKDVRKINGWSEATEWRLHQAGEGPPRVKISRGRWAYPEALYLKWLESRFERPLSQPAQ
jgi:predicted DNA-binding transcriptional regulator AlpA